MTSPFKGHIYWTLVSVMVMALQSYVAPELPKLVHEF